MPQDQVRVQGTPAFVPGGANTTIHVSQLPALKGRAFIPFNEKTLAADLYEQAHPGVTVRRDWEDEAQHAARVAKRKQPTLAEPELNMSPDRAERELKMKRAEIEGLDTKHPEYDRLFGNLAHYINLLEDVAGQKRTAYRRGSDLTRKEDPPPLELVEKLARYQALRKRETKVTSIESGKDVALLELIRQHETDAELQALAVQRINFLRSQDEDAVE